MVHRLRFRKIDLRLRLRARESVRGARRIRIGGVSRAMGALNGSGALWAQDHSRVYAIVRLSQLNRTASRSDPIPDIKELLCIHSLMIPGGLTGRQSGSAT